VREAEKESSIGERSRGMANVEQGEQRKDLLLGKEEQRNDLQNIFSMYEVNLKPNRTGQKNV
jgi:hypothetical protein